MYILRRFSFLRSFLLSWKLFLLIGLWSTLLTVMNVIFGFKWLQLPTLPVSVLGTAVSFYLGFKGNASYGRLWEARKIWGGIVNTSRTWGTYVTTMVTDLHNDEPAEKTLPEEHQKLIYRHIAWLKALRLQLLRPKIWEHRADWNNTFRKRYGTLDTSDQLMREELEPFLQEAELAHLMQKKNRATQLLQQQGEHIKTLFAENRIDSFRHMQLAAVLEEFYTLQGKCERIKNFPLPRQYATANHWFVNTFVFLLPLALLSAFHAPHISKAWVWGSIPASMLIGWVFYTWDMALEYSEIPFEGLINDIPMAALSRTIEIDLREILGETKLPPPIEPINGEILL